MSSTPSNPRTFTANTGLGLKVTPSNSPYARASGPRSPYARRSLYESGLSLQRIIGTTVTSPTAFDTLTTSRIFAYTAGAAAVVVDGTANPSQRFFRARPTAIPLATSNTLPYTPSTIANTANDGRNRTAAIVRDSAIPYSPNTAHTSLDWGDSPNSKTWTSRERIKAAACLSISGDGKFLAVGETGYSPRVLIFSLQDNSSDTPLVILNEHTYGIRAVAFSPDQKYLASLGSPNDGFLYVWSLKSGATKLHSSNKCTSFVRQMIWLGTSIVTVGTRHIKVWRPEENGDASPTKQKFALDGTPQPVPVQPEFRALFGRNCLLGPLVEATFTCVAAISDSKAIICSEKGDICLLDDSENLKLIKLANAGFSTTCIAVDMQDRRVRIGGRNGMVNIMNLDELGTPGTPPESPVPVQSGVVNNAAHLYAMGYAGGSLVTVDSNHLIEISNPDSDDADAKTQGTTIPAHGDAVMGVQLLSSSNSMNAAFLTWSANGTIVFWDLDGNSKASLMAELEQLPAREDEPANQCQVVRASQGVKFLVTGDRYGVLKMIDPCTKHCIFDTRAHISEIQDIALHESEESTLVASCGRDRTVQLYRRLADMWMLVQTMDEHSASVSSLCFAEDGEKLISCSSDRTIQIRQIVKKDVGGQDVMGAVPVRVITLKASPVSMALCSDSGASGFVVSLLDRSVATYDIASGRLASSFRATDNDGADAVVLDALVMGTPSPLPGRPTVLVGISGTDKSVRVYDGNTGAFLDREWGHTAAVTDVALLETPDSEQKTLISTGLDGTIMLWDLSPKTSGLQEPIEITHRDSSPSKDDTKTAARPPLRRVLSRAELAEFQRASPTSTPTSRGSPPRAVRRKTSRYGLSSQPQALAPPLPTSQHYTSVSEDSSKGRASPRTRSRSPPPSPKARNMRRPSLASLESRGRTKSSNNNFSEFGSLNMATEQACRTLRAYRKKLLSSESVKESALRELDQELRLTAMALSEKSLKSSAISDSVLTGLLDKISTMFDEKLRLTKLDADSSDDQVGPTERPKTAGGPISSH